MTSDDVTTRAQLEAACDEADQSTGSLTTARIRALLAGEDSPARVGPYFRGVLTAEDFEGLAKAIHEGDWMSAGGEWRWERAQPHVKRRVYAKATAAARALGLQVLLEAPTDQAHP